jgi:hypothetical protein
MKTLENGRFWVVSLVGGFGVGNLPAVIVMISSF